MTDGNVGVKYISPKKLIVLGLLLSFPTGADTVCRSIYNPMSGEWELICTDGPATCHQVYDPMNRVWVTVCDKPRQ